MKLTWLRSHYLVILLLIYSATRKCSRFCMTIRRAPLPVVCIHCCMAPLRPLSTDLLKNMCAIASVCASIIVGFRTNHALRRLWRTAARSSSFVIFFFSSSNTVPSVQPDVHFQKVVLWYDQLPPVTSLLPDFNGFANTVVLGLVCRLSLPGSHF